ncbi:MAG: hypothetical protein D3920_04945 [Candidatus Electrothrix sp. AW2]|nr:hypothetical protein [Candidatus Electrothrix gigas]
MKKVLIAVALLTGIMSPSVLEAQFNWSGGSNDPIGTRQGCFYIRSLNNNYQQSHRFLDGASDKKTVKLVDGRSHGTIWDVRNTSDGYVLRSMNKSYQSSPYYLDAESNGQAVKIQNGISHGVYWNMIGTPNRAQLRSKNRNHRNFLDGASDGRTVKLVSDTSHGTYWQLQSVKCPY